MSVKWFSLHQRLFADVEQPPDAGYGYTAPSRMSSDSYELQSSDEKINSHGGRDPSPDSGINHSGYIQSTDTGVSVPADRKSVV